MCNWSIYYNKKATAVNWSCTFSISAMWDIKTIWWKTCGKMFSHQRHCCIKSLFTSYTVNHIDIWEMAFALQSGHWAVSAGGVRSSFPRSRTYRRWLLTRDKTPDSFLSELFCWANRCCTNSFSAFKRSLRFKDSFKYIRVFQCIENIPQLHRGTL